MNEKITAAAIKFRGKVFIGDFHLDCHLDAVASIGRAGFEAVEEFFSELISCEGFVTSGGRFVDREKALQIARDSKQTKTQLDYLLSEELAR